MTQNIYRKGTNPQVVHLYDLHIVDNDSKPSWLRYGKGTARVEVQASNDPNRGGTWLSLNIEERAIEKGSSKATSITLKDDAARAVYAYLHEKFGGQS